MVCTEQQDEAEYQEHGVVQLVIRVTRPALDLPHDELVPRLDVLVLSPARGKGLAVRRKPGIPAELES